MSMGQFLTQSPVKVTVQSTTFCLALKGGQVCLMSSPCLEFHGYSFILFFSLLSCPILFLFMATETSENITIKQ